MHQIALKTKAYLVFFIFNNFILNGGLIYDL